MTERVDEAVLDVLRRWGLKTLGEFAALPTDALFERLGREGLELQEVARGRDARPLVPTVAGEPFEESLTLEWPIEELEPLSFVLTRLFEPLCARLERCDRGAAVLHVSLQLVSREHHTRRLELPAPMRDPKVLRTLVLLDLESHPPNAGIDRVTLTIDPTPGRIVQHSLLARPLPSPEQLSTLTARLNAVMGENRVGAPVLVDTHRPEAFDMQRFHIPTPSREPRTRASLPEERCPEERCPEDHCPEDRYHRRRSLTHAPTTSRLRPRPQPRPACASSSAASVVRSPRASASSTIAPSTSLLKASPAALSSRLPVRGGRPANGGKTVLAYIPRTPPAHPAHPALPALPPIPPIPPVVRAAPPNPGTATNGTSPSPTAASIASTSITDNTAGSSKPRSIELPRLAGYVKNDIS